MFPNDPAAPNASDRLSPNAVAEFLAHLVISPALRPNTTFDLLTFSLSADADSATLLIATTAPTAAATAPVPNAVAHTRPVDEIDPRILTMLRSVSRLNLERRRSVWSTARTASRASPSIVILNVRVATRSQPLRRALGP